MSQSVTSEALVAVDVGGRVEGARESSLLLGECPTCSRR